MSEQKIITKTHSKFSNKTNGILAKFQIKAIYYSVFHPLMRYACQVRGQSKNRLLTQIGKSQNNALRLLNFKHFMESSNLIYKKCKFLS